MSDDTIHSTDQTSRATVNDTLTPDRATGSARTERPARVARPRRRRRSEVENPDYAAFAIRVIRAHASRVADGDVEALAGLLRLAVEVDAATQTAVEGLRGSGTPGEIASRLYHPPGRTTAVAR